MKKVLIILAVIVFYASFYNGAYAEEYQEVSLGKLSIPAFAKDMADKKILVSGSFMSISPVMMDLPNKYRHDYIRIMLMEGMAIFGDALIPKNLSEQVFDLKQVSPVTLN